VGKAVLMAGRHDDELARRERHPGLADPHLGLPFVHVQDLLDGVQMGRRAVPRLAPLLEHAKLARAVLRRDAHLPDDTRPPFLLRRMREIDDLHGTALFRVCGGGRVIAPTRGATMPTAVGLRKVANCTWALSALPYKPASGKAARNSR